MCYHHLALKFILKLFFKKEIKDILIQYDYTLLIFDPHHCESKKLEGPDARAWYQKSYRKAQLKDQGLPL